MGNVRDGVTNTELRDEFKLCNAYSRKECKDCWAKYIAVVVVVQMHIMQQVQ